MNRRYINLLSWQFRFSLLLRERSRQWIVVWVAVLLIAPVVWQVKQRRFDNASRALTLMENRCAPLRTMQAENRRMSARLSELNGHKSLLKRLDDEQVPYRLMGLVSHSAQRCDGGIQLKAITINRVREKLEPVENTVSTKQKNKDVQYQEIVILQLNGMAVDNLAISRFVAALRDSGVFRTVDLRSSVGARSDKTRAQTFLVECKLIGSGTFLAELPTSTLRF